MEDIMKIVQTPVGSMAVFSYLIFDEATKEGILIDPAGDPDRLVQLLKDHDVKLRYIVNTHGHADHTCGNDLLRQKLGRDVPVVVHELDDDFFQRPESQQFSRAMGFPPTSPADVRLRDGDELAFGNLKVEFIHTPGHTPGACCILIDNNLFTGDTLFVGAVGRTDLPGASFPQLIESLRRIISLPPETVVWPGHDYGDQPQSTIEREMRRNPYITDFVLDGQ